MKKTLRRYWEDDFDEQFGRSRKMTLIKEFFYHVVRKNVRIQRFYSNRTIKAIKSSKRSKK